MRLNHMIRQAHQMQEDIPGYRVGQHFITLMGIQPEDDEQLRRLWNSTNEQEVMDIIHDLMGRYHWKGNLMPNVRECKYLGGGAWEFIDLNGAP